MSLMEDLRYGFRMLVKNPSITIAAALALALGIGANTGMFSVVRAVLLRPLPYLEAERLVQIWQTGLRGGGDRDWVSYPNFLDWRRENRVFDEMAAYRYWLFTVGGGDAPAAIAGLQATPQLFHVLGTRALLGRTLLAEDDQPGRERVVVLSYGLWQRQFGGDRSVIGRQIRVDGLDHTVVGVMPEEFQFPKTTPADLPFAVEVWLPMRVDPDLKNRESYNYWAVARLKPGVTIEQAQADLDAIALNLARIYPGSNEGRGVRVTALQRHLTRGVREPLLLLLGAIGLVLLIACLNVANLLLSRAEVRKSEIAIRIALGATRRRLVRQALTESTLLGLLGGLLGLLLATWGVDLFRTLGPSNIPRLRETTIDAQVLIFTLIVSVGTAFLFGLAPALFAWRRNAGEALKESGWKATPSPARRRIRGLLVAGELALAVMLLISAGLLIRSFHHLSGTDPGFDAHNLLIGAIMLPGSNYPEAKQQAAFFQNVLDRVQAIPGVKVAAAGNSLPLTGINDQGSFQIEGRPNPPEGVDWPLPNRPKVSSGYFEAMGITLLRGRSFTSQDRDGAPEVAIVSDVAARTFWPGEDPIGKRVSVNRRARQPVWREIIGIVKGVSHFGLDVNPRPEIYVPFLQVPSFAMFLAVRTHGEPAELAAATRRAVAALDPDQSIFSLQTMEQLVSDSKSHRRFQTLLLTVFAALAVILAAVGVYGVMVYAVTQQTREIGIRMALGAARSDVIRTVLGQGFALVLLGAGAGIAGALAVTRLLSRLLYGIAATDLLTFIGASLIPAAIALMACYIPARRAAKIDPMAALRYE
jgi:putative ABC transport system permease protein